MSAAATAANTAANQSSSTMASNIELCMNILSDESVQLSKKGKTLKFLNKIIHYNFENNEANDDEMMAIVRNFIYYQFNKAIYDDPLPEDEGGTNTGKTLITKLYFMFWTPERRAKAKKERADAHEKARIKKANDLTKIHDISAAKKADKEKLEILRLGKGDRVLGVKLYQERMDKQKKEKAQKAAVEMSKDDEKTFQFWQWRLETPEGKCYSIPIKPTHLKFVKRFGHVQRRKIISINHDCAKETLQYLLETNYATQVNIKFAPDSQGKVHFHSIVHKANNPAHHITMAPLVCMHFVGQRKTPEEISGLITNYQVHSGKFYIRTNESTMSNAHFLLPDKWIKFQEAHKYIGSKRYIAQPTTGPTVPLLLNILDPKAIESFSWVDNHVQYTAVVQENGKGLDYIKSLRGKSQAEKEAEALEKMAKEAKRQKERRRMAAIAREFDKHSGPSFSNAQARDLFASVEAGLHTKPSFCPHCRCNVTATNASWCSSCGKALH